MTRPNDPTAEDVHPLIDYLAAIGEPVADFAGRAGCDEALLRAVCDGAEVAPLTLARRIVALTDGAVPLDALTASDDPAETTGARIIDFNAARGALAPLDAARADALVARLMADVGMAEAAPASVAAEAVSHAFDLLAAEIPHPEDRLQTALCLILEEILKETPGPRAPLTDLTTATRRAAEAYFQARP